MLKKNILLALAMATFFNITFSSVPAQQGAQEQVKGELSKSYPLLSKNKYFKEWEQLIAKKNDSAQRIKGQEVIVSSLPNFPHLKDAQEKKGLLDELKRFIAKVYESNPNNPLKQYYLNDIAYIELRTKNPQSEEELNKKFAELSQFKAFKNWVYAFRKGNYVHELLNELKTKESELLKDAHLKDKLLNEFQMLIDSSSRHLATNKQAGIEKSWSEQNVAKFENFKKELIEQEKEREKNLASSMPTSAGSAQPAPQDSNKEDEFKKKYPTLEQSFDFDDFKNKPWADQAQERTAGIQELIQAIVSNANNLEFNNQNNFTQALEHAAKTYKETIAEAKKLVAAHHTDWGANAVAALNAMNTNLDDAQKKYEDFFKTYEFARGADKKGKGSQSPATPAPQPVAPTPAPMIPTVQPPAMIKPAPQAPAQPKPQAPKPAIQQPAVPFSPAPAGFAKDHGAIAEIKNDSDYTVTIARKDFKGNITRSLTINAKTNKDFRNKQGQWASDAFIIPWEDKGKADIKKGRLQITVKGANNQIISQAWLQERDDYIYLNHDDANDRSVLQVGERRAVAQPFSISISTERTSAGIITGNVIIRSQPTVK